MLTGLPGCTVNDAHIDRYANGWSARFRRALQMVAAQKGMTPAWLSLPSSWTWRFRPTSCAAGPHPRPLPRPAIKPPSCWLTPRAGGGRHHTRTQEGQRLSEPGDRWWIGATNLPMSAVDLTDPAEGNHFGPFADFTTPAVPRDVAAYEQYRRLSMTFVRARNQRTDEWVATHRR